MPQRDISYLTDILEAARNAAQTSIPALIKRIQPLVPSVGNTDS